MIKAIGKVINSEWLSYEDSLIINERSSSATVNKIEFINGDKFINIKTNLIEFLNESFSQDQLDSGTQVIDGLSLRNVTDGIFLVEKSGSWILCACELKSTLNGCKTFFKAKTQLEVSVFKIKLLLRAIKNFTIDSTVLFIARGVPNEREKRQIIRAKNRNDLNPGYQLYIDLCLKKKVELERDNCLLEQLSIKDEFLLSNCTLNLLDDAEGKQFDIREFLD